MSKYEAREADEIDEIEILTATIKDKIRLKPLQQWHCDSCNKTIDKAKDGWFEWLSEYENDVEKDFRIVHRDERCMYDSRREHHRGWMTKDMHLDHYISSNGLIRLLQILERSAIQDRLEVVIMIKRLHVPYFEEAFQYWGEALEDQFIESDPDEGPDSVENCLRIIEKYGS